MTIDNTQQLVLDKKFTVTSVDADMWKRLRLSSIVNVFIQAAISSADKLGFGYNNLQEQKLFWVFSRLHTEIYKPAFWKDEILVRTWPKTIDKPFYLRDFEIFDKEGNKLAAATSSWLAIDLETKRPKIIEGFEAKYFVKLKNKHGLNVVPAKLKPTVGETAAEYKTFYSDIDLNLHVTSTRYIDWMMDSLPLDFHKENYPKTLEINFVKETFPGDTVQIKQSECGEKSYSFEGLSRENDAALVRGIIGF